MSRIDALIAEHAPKGVQYEPLADIGDWYGGGTPSKGKPEYWKNGTIPWVSPKDMGRPIVDTTEDYITEAAVKGSATRLVPANSVAVVVRSSILDRILPTALIPVPVALNQDMKAVVARDGIIPGYIAHVLRSNGQDILRAARKTGGSVASIESRYVGTSTPRAMYLRTVLRSTPTCRAITAIFTPWRCKSRIIINSPSFFIATSPPTRRTMPDVSNLTLSGARPGQGQTNEVGNFQMSLLGHFTPPATSSPPKPNSATTPCWTTSPWPRNLNQSASDNPEAVQPLATGHWMRSNLLKSLPRSSGLAHRASMRRPRNAAPSPAGCSALAWQRRAAPATRCRPACKRDPSF